MIDVDLIIEADAAVKNGNPGSASVGFVALDRWMTVIFWDCRLLSRVMTSNEAEYWAAIEGLRFAKDLGYVKRVQLRSDSLTMINQMRGRYGFRNDDLRGVADVSADLIDSFDSVELIWVPRQWNARANFLSQKAFCNNPKSEIKKVNLQTAYEFPSSEQLRKWNEPQGISSDNEELE